MRMWDVPPATMCRQHLLGEHLEMHMFVGAIAKGTSMYGYIENGLLDVSKLQSRHDELVTEMTNRGMKHKSPLPEIPEHPWRAEAIDVNVSLLELAHRCAECQKLQDAYYK